MFTFNKTNISGPLIIKTTKHTDPRGIFIKIYDKEQFLKNNLKFNLGEHFYSFSKKNTIRGLHYQNKPHEQEKIVYVTKGKILDIFLDIRKNSKTYGKWGRTILSESNNRAIFIPKGFAHGFQALEDSIVEYLCSSEFSPKCYAGIRWNDKNLNIKWIFKNPIISKKDKNLPLFNINKK